MKRGQQEPLADEALARLTIYSEAQSAQELAERMGVAPDEAWNAGELDGRGQRYTTTAISYRSGVAPNALPSEHLADLVKRIEPLKDRLHDAVGGGSSGRLKLAVFADTDNPMFDLPADVLCRAGSLGFDLKFDIYLV